MVRRTFHYSNDLHLSVVHEELCHALLFGLSARQFNSILCICATPPVVADSSYVLGSWSERRIRKINVRSLDTIISAIAKRSLRRNDSDEHIQITDQIRSKRQVTHFMVVESTDSAAVLLRFHMGGGMSGELHRLSRITYHVNVVDRRRNDIHTVRYLMSSSCTTIWGVISSSMLPSSSLGWLSLMAQLCLKQ